MEIRKFGDRERSTFNTGTDTPVQQNLAEQCDINSIMAKYEKTKTITHLNTYQGEYGDFSEVYDFKTGLEKVMAAEEMFMSLPATIRDQFNNRAANFIEFATDEKNVDKLREMGLAHPKAPEAERPTLEAKGADKPAKQAKENPPKSEDQ